MILRVLITRIARKIQKTTMEGKKETRKKIKSSSKNRTQ
jgi:hypothetical protein